MARTARRRRYEVTELDATTEIPNQMLEDNGFDHAGRHAGLSNANPTAAVALIVQSSNGSISLPRP